MKRSALISLLLIYSISSFGIGTRQFYCCGKLTTTELTFVTEKTSSEGNNCCRTIFQSFIVKDSHVSADQVTLTTKHFTEVEPGYPSFARVAFSPAPMRTAQTIHGPPTWRKAPLHVFICVYRI